MMAACLLGIVSLLIFRTQPLCTLYSIEMKYSELRDSSTQYIMYYLSSIHQYQMCKRYIPLNSNAIYSSNI